MRLVTFRSVNFSLITLTVLVATACGPSSRGDDSGDDDDSLGCSGNETRCSGSVYQTCQGGTFADTETCAPPDVCVVGSGCQQCDPDLVMFCSGDAVFQCNPDGSTGAMVEQCAFESCANGACVDACSAAAQNHSYIGCEYWPVDLDNAVEIVGEPSFLPCDLLQPGSVAATIPTCPAALLGNPSQCDYGNVCPGGAACTMKSVCILNAQKSPYAVVVANPDPTSIAIVTLANATGQSMTTQVAPGAVQALFPQQMGFADQSLEFSGIEPKAYKLSSDRPVVAYQFNPLDNVGVFSNDASLLIPASTYDTRYIALIYPTLTRRPNAHDYSGYITVVASSPGQTQVVVNATAGVRAGTNVAAFGPGSQTFTLNQFDTLNLESVGDGDLSGTTVDCAPKCGVFVGTEASGIGGVCCADHLEDQLFPASTWGKVYAVAKTEMRMGERDLIRIMAQKPNTTISFNPAPMTGTCGTLNVGQFCEVEIREDTEISGSEPILVGHYQVSVGGMGPMSGDPDIAFAVPTEQYRLDYSFLVPSQYANNYASLVAPVGAPVRLDGVDVSAMLDAFGSGAYGAVRLRVEAGQHQLECPMGCGVEVYGYDEAVSYLYAGGLDLEQIVVE